MKEYRKWVVVLIVVLATVACVSALADEISTSVVMRVSRLTQNAVINAGEDLSLEVGIDGVEPASYQWYFADVAITGADQCVYNIVKASVEDSGTYRLEAFDETGKMLVSMDVSVRVIDGTLPQSGDRSLPVSVAVGAFVLAAGAMVLTLRRRARV